MPTPPQYQTSNVFGRALFALAAVALVGLLSQCKAGELSGGLGAGTGTGTGTGSGGCDQGCTQPPRPLCLDGKTLQIFLSPGSCVDGRCQYDPQKRTCQSTCQNNLCTGEDPCIGVTCNSPPANTCKDANTLTTFDATGTCAAGKCTYGSKDSSCPSGCSGAACQGDPCAGVVCNSPPNTTCSGNNVRTYQSPGTCSAGKCSYTHSDTPCSSGCSAGACTVTGGTLHVDDGAGSGGNGTASNPFNSISSAISAASSGTLIKVAAGSYGPITISKSITLQGGYKGNGDFTTRNVSTHRSTIQGSSTAAVRMNSAGSAVLDGFRITGGRGVSSSGRMGAGVYVNGGSPTISNCVIENNGSFGSQESRGGGIYSKGANTKILNNVIRNNKSGRGGAIAVEGGTVRIEGNTIENNAGNSDHGGGIEGTGNLTITRNIVRGNEIGRSLGYGWGGGIDLYNRGTTGTLSFNIVTNNYAPTIGSGVFVDDGATATLTNELIYANKCGDTGGAGIYVDGGGGSGSTMTIRFSTIANNACSGRGEGVYVERGSSVTIENSIFWGNGGDDFYTDGGSSITARYTTSQESKSGTGNTRSNPLFVNTSGADFHLRSTRGHWNGSGWTNDSQSSPAIDKASPSASFSSEPSPNGGRANMGRYGNTSEASRTP